jgi:mono/diheme cytochrome c family protein
VMRRLLMWLGVALLLAIIAGIVFVRGRGIGTDREAWPLEERMARASWRFLVPREIRDRPNPVADSAEVRTEGLEHFADHCAVCHANNGSGDSMFGTRVFPRVPDLRLPRTQQLSDGELFYAIEQGVPWTAMPRWKTGTPEGEIDSWKLVRFIRYLPAITTAELTQMEKLNPRSPSEDARDREIDEFLKGGAAPKASKGHTHTHK